MMSRICRMSPVFLLAVSSLAAAQVDCVRRQGGGYSCFDYQRGFATDVVPREGGGVSTFDHETGNYRETVPRRGGGYSTYDSRTGTTREVVPRRDGGWRSHDQGVGIGGGLPRQGIGGGFDTMPGGQPGTLRRRPDGGVSIDPY